MAGSASPIQELRTSLEKSRWELLEGLLRLENRLQPDLQPPPSAVEAVPPAPGLPSQPHLRQGQAPRIIWAALMAGLAAGLSWSRRKR